MQSGPLDRHVLRLRLLATGIFALAMAALLFGAEHAVAAFPGTNGKIAYTDFSTEPFRIVAVNPDGSSPQPLTSGPKSALYPMYSADGSKIAFEGEDTIGVMNADGSGRVDFGKSTFSVVPKPDKWVANYDVPNADPPRTIPWVLISEFVVHRHSFQDPAFAPDGKHLVADERDFEEIEQEVCAVTADNDPACIQPPDPDFYFDFEYQCPKCSSHLVTLDAATGAVTGQLTPVVLGTADSEPAYSASGSLAFRRNDLSSGSETIFTIASPGAPATQVTPGTDNYGPEFSPDGSRIAFVHDEKEIATVAATGGPVTLLPMPPIPAPFDQQFPSDPAFSPDGTQIAFGIFRNKSGSEGPTERALVVMGTDGSGAHKISEGTSPAWQPIPIPPPPVVKSKVKSKKGKIKLDKKHRAKIATVTCGSAACALKAASSKLKAGKKKCAVSLKFAKTLAAGASGQVTAVVKGKCLAKLEAAGKGKLSVKLSVTGANGTETLSFKVTLLPRLKPHKG